MKRRTRSDREIDEDSLLKYYGNDNSCPHVPVLVGEVLDVFASVPLRSFVDCTLGAAGHSSAVCVSAVFLIIKVSFPFPFLSILGELVRMARSEP